MHGKIRLFEAVFLRSFAGPTLVLQVCNLVLFGIERIRAILIFGRYQRLSLLVDLGGDGRLIVTLFKTAVFGCIFMSYDRYIFDIHVNSHSIAKLSGFSGIFGLDLVLVID